MAQMANIELMKSQARKNNVEANNMDEGGVQHENMIMDNIIKKFTGLEAKDYYEQVSKPNRGIQSKTTADELEARQAIATTLYDLWLSGKLEEKANAEIEALTISNEKNKAETQNIKTTFNILQENLKGAKIANIIAELEKDIQIKTGVDKNSNDFLKIISRLLIKLGL